MSGPRTTKPERSDPSSATAVRRRIAIGVGLAAILAIFVYVASTAQKGLPLEQRRQIAVELPNAQRLIPTNDVRMAGVTVGRISAVEAIPPRDGRSAYVRVELELEKSAPRVTTDTTVRVRTSSALGANFVELDPGHAQQELPEHGTLPLANARPTVELTSLFETFRRSTRINIRRTLGELGTGLAGRGPAINRTIEAMPGMLARLGRVSRTLAAPRTQLSHFLHSYETFSGSLASVSPELRELIADGDVTLGAFARERGAIARTLDVLPSTEATTTRALTRLSPSLDGVARLAEQLRPSTRMLRGSLGRLDATLRAGDGPLRALPPFSHALRPTFATLRRVARRPSTDGAVRKLDDAVNASQITLKTLSPGQVHCNIVSSMLNGFYRMMTGLGLESGPPIIPFSFTHLGAEGELLQQPKPSRNVAINYVPNENENECESGNERHDAVTQRLGNLPGNQGTDHHTTEPPPDAVERARKAGLLDDPLTGVGK